MQTVKALLLITGWLILVAMATAGEVTLNRSANGTPVLANDFRTRPQRAVSSRWMGQRRIDVDAMVRQYAAQSHLDPDLVHAVIQVESGYNARAQSQKGAIGLMQLMPATAAELAVSDPWDAEQNIGGGTRYLKHLLERFDGRLEWALAGYNAGPEAVQRYQGIPPYAETQNFVRRVLALYNGQSPSPSTAAPVGRPVYLQRTAAGGLLLTTTPPTVASRKP